MSLSEVNCGGVMRPRVAVRLQRAVLADEMPPRWRRAPRAIFIFLWVPRTPPSSLASSLQRMRRQQRTEGHGQKPGEGRLPGVRPPPPPWACACPRQAGQQQWWRQSLMSAAGGRSQSLCLCGEMTGAEPDSWLVRALPPWHTHSPTLTLRRTCSRTPCPATPPSAWPLAVALPCCLVRPVEAQTMARPRPRLLLNLRLHEGKVMALPIFPPPTFPWHQAESTPALSPS